MPINENIVPLSGAKKHGDEAAKEVEKLDPPGVGTPLVFGHLVFSDSRRKFA